MMELEPEPELAGKAGSAGRRFPSGDSGTSSSRDPDGIRRVACRHLTGQPRHGQPVARLIHPDIHRQVSLRYGSGENLGQYHRRDGSPQVVGVALLRRRSVHRLRRVYPGNQTGKGLSDIIRKKWNLLFGNRRPFAGKKVGHIGCITDHYHANLQEGAGHFNIQGHTKPVGDLGRALGPGQRQYGLAEAPPD